MSACAIGVFYRSDYEPRGLVPFTRRAEALGFDEMWVAEDSFYAGGIAQAGVALATAEKMAVGSGILPAVSRNAAFMAMEIAALARMFPGRYLPGIGHGVRGWMRQIGELPRSPLGALEEHVVAIRALLHGQKVTTSGAYVTLDEVQLDFAPESVPPVTLGVRGPKSLQLAGRIADGTMAANGASPAYLRWAREQINMGRKAAGRTEPHRLTCGVLWSMDEDSKTAKDRARSLAAWSLAYSGNHVYSDVIGVTDEVQAQIEEKGFDEFAAQFPDEWLNQLAAAGTFEECAAALQDFIDAGLDSVVLFPLVDAGEALADSTADLIAALR